ncbi:hypothetical protein HQN89_02240 [Paenibacillus frigoriresistens]|uniref:hypothetical protein n=1 Tax=Paenibacillus alginolyticus TaxID=59839 RepID=UPI0015637D70|nr:hypothetical protein [Paenibacillus frigoriresistens]NRF89859.1 hypothetical protein [Paenibacillus frigoriresistens]
MWKYMFNRFLGNEISKYVDSKNKAKRQQKESKKRFEVHREQLRQEESQKETTLRIQKEKFNRHINLANSFLCDVVKLEQMIDENAASIKDFFDYNGNTKIYKSIFLTTPQKEELKKQLDLKPADYIAYPQTNYQKDEASTIEFIFENTSIFKSLQQKMSLKRYVLYANAKFPTIYFFLRFDSK